MTGILNALIAGVSGAVKDAYFNLVSLLLPGNGTNGAQNNTFLDSSTNNFTITRNGNTTQGTFSPFSQTGWGNYFDGTRDYLTLPSTSNLAFGTGDFSIEAWVYPTSVAEESIISNGTTSGAGDTQLTFYISNSVKLSGWFTIFLTGSTNVSLNTWSHVVVCRTGTTMSIFLNGLRDATGTVSNNFSSTNAFFVGAYPSGAVGDFNGYISNLRILKGSSAYDPTQTTITVPTKPLTAITNTQLLTCQSNRFLDNSANNFTITAAGSPSVVAFSPFAPTAAYTTAAVGGSGYFDGTGDYLTAPGNTAFDLGSGDFTIEAWIYTQGSGSRRFIDYANGTATNANFSFSMLVTSGNVAYGSVVIGSTVYAVTGTTTVTNTWTHVALVRNGTASGNLKLYVNGVAEGTAASLGSTAINTLTGTPYLSISSYYNGGGEFFNGYVSSARIIKGTALYTGNFTPSTAPFTAVSGTSLLLNFTNAGVVDATAKNVLETVGNAQISTSVSKFGGGSIAFNASANTYLSQNPATTDMYAFGSGDFTIEYWLYLSSTTGIQTVYDGRPNGSSSAAVPTIYITSGSIRYLVSAVDRITGSTLSTGQWYHIAVARSGGSTRMFINGTQAGSTYTDSTVYLNSANRPFIGGDSNTPNNNLLNGYIDDLRITKGYARYTANFTAPTAPFPVQ
jgi:hypothetical protein